METDEQSLRFSGESPDGAVDKNVLGKFAGLLNLETDEEVFFFQETATPAADLAGFIKPMVHLLVSSRRILGIARDKKGQVSRADFPVEKIRSAEATKGFITDELELVVADPAERLVKYGFIRNQPGYKREHLAAVVDFVKNRKGGFEKTASVVTSSGVAAKTQERKADIQRFAQEWTAQKASLLGNLPALLASGQEVTIGVRHPDFDDWIAQNLGVDEKVVARCYSGDEALVVSTDKVILLKKGKAKAAVSSSGIGTTAGAFSDSWLGLAAGIVADIAVGAKGVIAKSIDFYNITSIDCTKGFTFGHIEFTFAGAKEVKTGGFAQNAVSENVFQFLNEFHDFMVAIANEIRRRVKLARQPQPVVVQGQPVIEGIPDQIRKLAGLRDAGILTDEEFQAKKTELLAKM